MVAFASRAPSRGRTGVRAARPGPLCVTVAARGLATDRDGIRRIWGWPSQNRLRISAPSLVGRTWFTSHPAASGGSLSPTRAQMCVVPDVSSKPSRCGSKNRMVSRCRSGPMYSST
jgi:hypothetical protein